MEKEISTQCQKIYEELEITRKELRLSLRQLSDKSFHKQNEEEAYLDSSENADKHYEKYKKIFQRKSWSEGKAKQSTLDNLEKLRENLYKTDEYRAKESVCLNPKSRERLQKISEELEKALLMQSSIDEE